MVLKEALAVALILAGIAPSFGSIAIEPVDLIIRGGTVVTMDASGRVIEDGAVATRGARIIAVGTRSEIASRYRARRTIEAAGKVIMPGLINSHTHAPMVLFRGIADDMALMEWLQKYIFPAEARNVDRDFVRWGTRLACLEMIRGGITTFADMYYFEDVIAEETAACGMRAVLAETLIDFPAPDNKTWEAALDYAERFIKRWKGHELIVPAVAPHAPYTVSTDHLKQARQMAASLGVPLMIHLAEDQAEMKFIGDTSSIAYLDRIGFFDIPVIAAHVVWPTEQDIAILARHRVGIAHCPQSNMKLAAGVAPVLQMLRSGIAVGLGTDGAASNNDLNLWEEMDSAAKLHKLYWKDPTALSARQALEMATILGARALGLDREIGSLEAGKRADLIIVRMSAAHQVPLYNIYSHLVYATKASDVETVIINGKVVMERGRVLTINERQVKAMARQYADRIRESLGRQARLKACRKPATLLSSKAPFLGADAMGDRMKILMEGALWERRQESSPQRRS
jgi:5-methylthioadenosine/S-adenosylhomocysteine deaminase